MIAILVGVDGSVELRRFDKDGDPSSIIEHRVVAAGGDGAPQDESTLRYQRSAIRPGFDDVVLIHMDDEVRSRAKRGWPCVDDIVNAKPIRAVYQEVTEPMMYSNALLQQKFEQVEAAWLKLGGTLDALRAEIDRRGNLGAAAESDAPRAKPPEIATFPCTACGVYHQLDAFPPDARVVTTSGAVGTVMEWRQYGGPLRVRVQWTEGGVERRDYFYPCELRRA